MHIDGSNESLSVSKDVNLTVVLFNKYLNQKLQTSMAAWRAVFEKL